MIQSVSKDELTQLRDELRREEEHHRNELERVQSDMEHLDHVIDLLKRKGLDGEEGPQPVSQGSEKKVEQKQDASIPTCDPIKPPSQKQETNFDLINRLVFEAYRSGSLPGTFQQADVTNLLHSAGRDVPSSSVQGVLNKMAQKGELKRQRETNGRLYYILNRTSGESLPPDKIDASTQERALNLISRATYGQRVGWGDKIAVWKDAEGTLVSGWEPPQEAKLAGEVKPDADLHHVVDLINQHQVEKSQTNRYTRRPPIEDSQATSYTAEPEP